MVNLGIALVEIVRLHAWTMFLTHPEPRVRIAYHIQYAKAADWLELVYAVNNS